MKPVVFPIFVLMVVETPAVVVYIVPAAGSVLDATDDPYTESDVLNEHLLYYDTPLMLFISLTRIDATVCGLPLK